MIFQELLLIALGIFVVLYIAYFIGVNKLRKNKVYALLLNCVSIVLCLVLLFDAIKEGRSAFILILLLLLGVKKLIEETKKEALLDCLFIELQQWRKLRE